MAMARGFQKSKRMLGRDIHQCLVGWQRTMQLFQVMILLRSFHRKNKKRLEPMFCFLYDSCEIRSKGNFPVKFLRLNPVFQTALQYLFQRIADSSTFPVKILGSKRPLNINSMV
jgi:hypothetical protein